MEKSSGTASSLSCLLLLSRNNGRSYFTVYNTICRCALQFLCHSGFPLQLVAKVPIWLLARLFWPCSHPSCPPPPAIILWLVSLDRVRDERCLIIAPASSWTSSQPESVFLDPSWKQSAVNFPNCIWFSLAQSLQFYPSFTLHPLISKFPFFYLLFNLSYWALGEHVFFLTPGMPYASQCITLGAAQYNNIL